MEGWVGMESTCRGPLTTLRQDRLSLTGPEDCGGVVPPRRRPERSNRAPEEAPRRGESNRAPKEAPRHGESSHPAQCLG